MILVTGATGNVGGELVRVLAGVGQPVQALTRDDSPKEFPPGVQQAVGDLNKPESMRAALSGATAMFLYPGYQDMAGTLAAARRRGRPPGGDAVRQFRGQRRQEQRRLQVHDRVRGDGARLRLGVDDGPVVRLHVQHLAVGTAAGGRRPGPRPVRRGGGGHDRPIRHRGGGRGRPHLGWARGARLHRVGSGAAAARRPGPHPRRGARPRPAVRGPAGRRGQGGDERRHAG